MLAMLDAIPVAVLVVAALLAGFIGLIWSADRFVAGSAAIARSFGLAPLIIGLTIVSFGTSAPEVMVSISASLKDAGDLAVGNAIGSNIANIGLVLGATTLAASIPVQNHILRHELPILLAVTVMAGIFLWDARLTLVESLILAASLIPAIYYLVRVKKQDLTPGEVAEEEELISEMPRRTAFMWFMVGLIALMLSSEVLVWGAKTAAEMAGVSPFIIGLTVIAIGTSLPELAASMVSAIKGHHDIALGNIVGSNMFNLMAVMSVPGLFAPTTMEPAVFTRDYTVMLALTLLLTALAVQTLWLNRRSGGATLGKMTGALLLAGYIAYYFVLFQTNS